MSDSQHYKKTTWPMKAKIANQRDNSPQTLAARAFLRICRAGWNDAVHNRPFDPSYEAWTPSDQHNYERMRLVVAAMRYEGTEPAIWPRTTWYDARTHAAFVATRTAHIESGVPLDPPIVTLTPQHEPEVATVLYQPRRMPRRYRRK